MVERERLSLSVGLEMDAMTAIGKLVEEPDWFTILPPTALGEGLASGRLRAARLAVNGFSRTLVCAHGARRPMSLAGHRFAEMLGEELRTRSDELLRGCS
jgi:DNA-binding transcriptional LysR family regulator